MTTWRDVPGFEGFYQVSTAGEVRSMDRRIQRADGHTALLKGRILQPYNENGCTKVTLYRSGKRKERVSHLVLETFVGPAPVGTECCHGDGDFANNSLTNLRWDTHSANVFDQVRHGTHACATKLTCIRGHDLTPENINPRRGKRDCRSCERIRNQKRSAQRKAERHRRRLAA